MRSLVIRPREPPDDDWVRTTLEDAWGSVSVARRGELLDASTFPGFVAVANGRRLGLAIVAVRGDEYEILSICTEIEGQGVGRALMECGFEDARSRGCRRVWLTTTNNNIGAFAFYQHLGMDLCSLHHDAVAAARRLKPSISRRDGNGVPILHELEFELLLDTK